MADRSPRRCNPKMTLTGQVLCHTVKAWAMLVAEAFAVVLLAGVSLPAFSSQLAGAKTGQCITSSQLVHFANGLYRDECRFPHVMPEGPLPHHSGQFPSRGGSRGRGGHNNNGSHHFKVIEEKFAAMALQEVFFSSSVYEEFSKRATLAEWSGSTKWG